MAANIARELAEHTRNHLYGGDIAYSVSAMVQLVNLLDVQLRNLTPGGKDSAARSLNKVSATEPFIACHLAPEALNCTTTVWFLCPQFRKSY